MGEKDSIRYWEIKNSWGEYGYSKGYCKITFSIDTLGSSIKLTYGNLNYNNILDNIQVYAIDEDNSWYGPVVDVTVWDKTNPDTTFTYNIQQNFWTAFHPNPPLTIKSGTWQQTWNLDDIPISNNLKVFNGSVTSYKNSVDSTNSELQTYSRHSSQVWINSPDMDN